MRWLIPLFTLLALTRPAHSSDVFKYHQVSMGTTVEITLIGSHEEEARKAAMQAFQEIKRIEQLMSPKATSGDVFRINQSSGLEWVSVSPETMRRDPQGERNIDPLGGRLRHHRGPAHTDLEDGAEKGIPPAAEEVTRVLERVNFREILTSPEGKLFLKKKGMAIDLGGIAKGYAVDRAFEVLQSLGYENVIVNAGGDLRVGGRRLNQPWTIGIQHPGDPEKIMAKVLLSGSAMATSGNYQKFFMHQGKRYGHIFNPRDGFPTEACQSVSIFHQGLHDRGRAGHSGFCPRPGKGICPMSKAGWGTLFPRGSRGQGDFFSRIKGSPLFLFLEELPNTP